MDRRKTWLFFLAFLVPGLLAFYWGQFHLGIDVLPRFDRKEDLPPLNGLQLRDYLIRPRPGEVLLSASFDEVFPLLPWGELWAREKGLAESVITGGGAGGTKCLAVRNQSARDWSLPASTAYEVRPGDTFAFEADGRTAGLNRAAVSIILYDEDRGVLKRGYAPQVVNGAKWTKHARRFTVPEGARYIRLQLEGSGVGEAYYDNIRFRREK